MKSSVEIVVDPGVGDRGASVTVTVSQEEGIMSVRVEERHQTPYRDKWWLQPIEGPNKEGKFGGGETVRTDNLSQFLDNLDRGTRCYREREVLRRVLRRFGPMSQDRFDEIFGDDRTFVDPVTHHTYTRPRRLKIRFAAVNSRAIILGPNAPGEWGQWLHLIQIMTLLGEVRAGIRDKGKVWYWLGEEEWDRGRQRNADGQ